MQEKFSVKIDKLVYGGDGISRLEDGRTIFIPFVLPGETVEVEITEDKGRFVRGYPKNILNPSPDRIKPLCPHFGSCGGCHYQYIDYEKQLDLKQSILMDQLRRIGKIENPPLRGITPSEKVFNYRNHVQFHLTEDGSLGFMDLSGRRPVRIEECHLPLPGIDKLWHQVDLSPESGVSKIVFREDSLENPFIILEGETETPPEMELDLNISVSYRAPDGQTFTMAGDDFLTYELLDKTLLVSPESFYQINTQVAEKMVQHVIKLLSGKVDLKILELYAGVGLFSVFLAEKSTELLAIESSLSACYDFANNLDSYDHVSLYEGPVEVVLPNMVSLIQTPDLVLLDPPRAGLHPKAREALLQINPKEIIYISCDPSTLARDLRHFIEKGYNLEDVHTFDMFPQTYHVETIVVIHRAQRVTS